MEYCIYCDRPFKKTITKQRKRSLTKDHIVPKSKGGNNSKYNIVPCCYSCNTSKSNLTLEQWKMELEFRILFNSKDSDFIRIHTKIIKSLELMIKIQKILYNRMINCRVKQK